MSFTFKMQHTSTFLLVQILLLFIITTTTKAQEEEGGESGEQGETASPEWEYRHQNRWARDFPECGGRRQSPVNIDPKRVVKLIDGKLGSGLHLRGYGRFRRSYNVTNTGRSIMFTYAGRREAVPSISGLAVGGNGGQGEREQSFVLQQFHFHWGQVEGVGSEHTLGGDRYDMEVSNNKRSSFILLQNLKLFSVSSASSSALQPPSVWHL